jgi:hypothetical protein
MNTGFVMVANGEPESCVGFPVVASSEYAEILLEP